MWFYLRDEQYDLAQAWRRLDEKRTQAVLEGFVRDFWLELESRFHDSMRLLRIELAQQGVPTLGSHTSARPGSTPSNQNRESSDIREVAPGVAEVKMVVDTLATPTDGARVVKDALKERGLPYRAVENYQSIVKAIEYKKKNGCTFTKASEAIFGNQHGKQDRIPLQEAQTGRAMSLLTKPAPRVCHPTRLEDGYQLCARCGNILCIGESVEVVYRGDRGTWRGYIHPSGPDWCGIYTHPEGKSCGRGNASGWQAVERAIDRREFNQATYREAQSVTLWGSVRPFVSLLDNKQLDLEREAVDYYGNEKLESQLKQKRSEQGEEENEKPFLLEYNVMPADQSSRV